MVARAIETTTFFLYANLIGTEKNLVYWGGDTIVGPRGDIIAKGKYYEEARVEAELALEDLVYARENRPTLRDTRFDVFEILHELGKPKSK
jgi:predicted amidohydrolase